MKAERKGVQRREEKERREEIGEEIKKEEKI
jgi:hypothetical protein